MTREEADFIGGMNMCDEISNEAYKKIMCHCEGQEPTEFEEIDFVQEHKKIPVTLDLTPCDDAISRQAVLSKIIEVCFSEEWVQFRVDKGSNGQRDFLINYITQLPSVTPQQKMGRWIKSRDCYGNNHFTCSFCGNDIATKYDGIWKDNYCSNRGAKMHEAESEKQAEEGQ